MGAWGWDLLLLDGDESPLSALISSPEWYFDMAGQGGSQAAHRLLLVGRDVVMFFVCLFFLWCLVGVE